MKTESENKVSIEKNRFIFMVISLIFISFLLGALISLKITESNVNRLRDKVDDQKVQIEKIQKSDKET